MFVDVHPHSSRSSPHLRHEWDDGECRTDDAGSVSATPRATQDETRLHAATTQSSAETYVGKPQVPICGAVPLVHPMETDVVIPSLCSMRNARFEARPFPLVKEAGGECCVL